MKRDTFISRLLFDQPFCFICFKLQENFFQQMIFNTKLNQQDINIYSVTGLSKRFKLYK